MEVRNVKEVFAEMKEILDKVADVVVENSPGSREVYEDIEEMVEKTEEMIIKSEEMVDKVEEIVGMAVENEEVKKVVMEVEKVVEVATKCSLLSCFWRR
jgi:uncharacterized circularly permuted ATP-grasp superfamily protein